MDKWTKTSLVLVFMTLTCLIIAVLEYTPGMVAVIPLKREEKTPVAVQQNPSLGNLDREWQGEQLRSLSKRIQDKIYQTMNPENCQEKKKIFCDLKWICGFGCEIHHVVFCLITALFYGRPLVLLTDASPYSRKGWEAAFKPISETCQNVTFKRHFDRKLRFIDFWKLPNRDHFPLAIPEDLVPIVVGIHGNPACWWIGQIATYLLRLQPVLSNYIEDVKEKIGFKTPIVGYPHYEIINDSGALESAGLQKRFNLSSLFGVVTDMYLLAQSDFLVCTFSSNLGRLAFEVMQALHTDASQNVRSLDALFYFHGQNKHLFRAMQDHVPRGPRELRLNTGDRIVVKKILQNGYVRSQNQNTGKEGRFPFYKIEDIVNGAKFSVKFL